jgi:hypothetical protein
LVELRNEISFEGASPLLYSSSSPFIKPVVKFYFIRLSDVLLSSALRYFPSLQVSLIQRIRQQFQLIWSHHAFYDDCVSCLKTASVFFECTSRFYSDIDQQKNPLRYAKTTSYTARDALRQFANVDLLAFEQDAWAISHSTVSLVLSSFGSSAVAIWAIGFAQRATASYREACPSSLLKILNRPLRRWGSFFSQASRKRRLYGPGSFIDQHAR